MANLRVDKITSTETFETTGSVQFDGTDDHFNLTSSDIAFGTGDFTLECWVYFSSKDNSLDCIMETRSSTSTSDGFLFGRFQTSGHEDKIELYTGGTYRITGDVTTPDNTWVHTAVVRESGTTKLYVNGTASSSAYIDSNNYSNDDLIIGENVDNNYQLDGFISNFRMVKGTAVYTSNFKPPMRELEVTPETVLLACQSKTDATHEKTGKTLTANGGPSASELTPGILTPVPKAGAGSAITGSVEFTGDPAKLEATSTDFAMGDSDLTMECWFYNGVDTITHMVQIDVDGGATNFSLATRDAAAGDVRFLVRNDSGSNLSDLIGGAPGAKINAWHHLAGTIEGTTTRLFLNGVLIKSGTISGTRTHTGDKLTLGANETSRYLKGYLSNVRIVKGTALYTKDFIPPTRELKKVPGTVLLACQDPDNPTTEATGKTITGYGDLHEATDVEMLTNGSFAGGYSTEWEAKNSANLSHSNGKLTVTSTQNYSGVKVKSAYLPSLVVDRQYVMTIDLESVTNTIRFGVVSNLTVDNISTAGRHSGVFTAGAVTEVFIEKPTGSNSTFVLKSVSIRELNTPNKASNFTPQVGDDRKVTLEGVTKINSDAYFYLPTGDTYTRDSSYGRGVRAGGYSGTTNATIEYFNIAYEGESREFGDLTVARETFGGCSSNTRGLFAAGNPGSSPNNTDNIDFITFSNTADAIDFGNLGQAKRGLGSCSNQTRGIFAGGDQPGTTNIIDYVTIATIGNTRDFGDLTSLKSSFDGCSSPVRAIFGGGNNPSVTDSDVIDYVTISSKGNALDFGNLTDGRRNISGCSSSTRAIFGGGRAPGLSTIIDYVTIASTGDATDFGDLTVARNSVSGVSNDIRGVFQGGSTPGVNATIDFVTIANTANATAWGTLKAAAYGLASASDSHGGLG